MGNEERVILYNFWRDRSTGPGECGQTLKFFGLYTTHQFGHFRFTDFDETWQEYMNHYPHESFLPRDARSTKRGIAIVSRSSVCLSVRLSVRNVECNTVNTFKHYLDLYLKMGDVYKL